ncbi:DUF4221 family protein [Roseivirga echinicomitans]
MKYISISILYIVISSCSRNDGSYNYVKQNLSGKIEQVGTLVFKLDSETTFEANGPVESTDYYVFYNSPTKSYKFYDKESFELAKTVALDSEGPNSVASPMGFTFDDQSNLSVYDFGRKEIFVIDSTGLVINSYKVEIEHLSRSSVFPVNISPLNYIDGAFFMSAQGNHLQSGMINHSDETIVRLMAKDKSINTFLNYPENYNNFIRGGRQSVISTTINSNTGSLIVGFPLEDDLFELTKGGEVIRHDIEPSIFDGFDGHYFSSLNRLSKSSYKDVNEKYLGNYSYWTVYYDVFSDCYYRFVNVPLTEYEMSLDTPKESELRDYVLQVFDSNFKLIALSEVLEDINIVMSPGARVFSTDNGIHVFAKNQLNEDEMRFITLKLSDEH